MAVHPDSPPLETPEWVKDAVFYQIFPDRFAASPQVPKPNHLDPWGARPTLHGFQGGDLAGVAEHLDYLHDLGITAIYFTPVFQSTANHRYHTYDYYNVDPICGGNAALRTLLDAAHARGMRIVLDGVFNHASRGFFQFNHILENGANSPYRDWFNIRGYPIRAYEDDHQYDSWYGLPALPKFNTNLPAVREFIWDVARHWTDFGIDGWRLDVPNEINDDSFWREFRRRVKDGNPEAYIVGEIWGDASRWLQGDQFDAAMNYLFTKACLGFFIRDFDTSITHNLGPHHISQLNAPGFARSIHDLLRLYDPRVTAVQMNLLDSHDTPRFLSLAKGDESALRLATLFQMTYPGAPSIYYGDEIGFGMAVPVGKRPRYDTATDPDTRRTFVWEEKAWNHDLRAYFKRCIALRKAHPALRRGDFTALYAEGSVYAFRRHLPNETLVVALNTGGTSIPVNLPAGEHLANGTLLRDVWSGEMSQVANGHIKGGRLPAREGRVWLAIEAAVDEFLL
jgi:cyclomaltodextrinase / maltogenic alpha-amylase / neopullulanase